MSKKHIFSFFLLVSLFILSPFQVQNAKAASEVEPNDTVYSANQVPLNELFNGVISNSTDKEYFRFTLTKETEIKLSITKPTNTAFYLRIFNYDFSTNDCIYTSYGNGQMSTVRTITLPKGDYNLFLKVSYGNNTNVPYTLEITEVDTTPPAIPTANKVTNKATKVTGKTEAGATVYVYSGTTKLGSATATASGYYSVTIPVQKKGTSLQVYAEDSAGNKSDVKTITVVNYDTTPPTIPTVNKVTNKATKVTGKTEAGATVYVYSGTKKLGSATATASGSYSVTIPVQKKGTSLKIYAKDKAGNKSGTKTVTVVNYDTTPPAIPSVNKVTTKSTTVTGKAEAGATVYVYRGTKKLGSAIATKKGTYTVKIAKQKKNVSLKVYAKDKAGNKSKVKTVKVS